MRLPTSITIAALAGAALAVPAEAAWLPLEPLDAGGAAASAPLLSPSRGGAATVLFKADIQAARATVGEDLSTGAFRKLPAGYTVAAADARGRALLARVERGILRVRTVAPAGRLGPRMRVARDAGAVSLAVNRAGKAVVATIADGRVLAATGDTRSGFGAAQRLSGRRAIAVDAAVNGAGDAVVAFRRRGVLQAADRRAGARRFAAPRELGTSVQSEQPELDVALGARGAAIAAYTDGEDFVAATRERRGAWREPQLLEDGNTGAGIAPAVAVVGDGAVLGYIAPTGVAKLAQGPLDGQLGAPADLSSDGTRVLDLALAAGADGGVAVLWAEDFVVRAAVQPAGGPLGAAEALDTAGRAVIRVAVTTGRPGRFTAAVESGNRSPGSRDIRLTAFAP